MICSPKVCIFPHQYSLPSSPYDRKSIQNIQFSIIIRCRSEDNEIAFIRPFGEDYDFEIVDGGCDFELVLVINCPEGCL
jgi:hypothetical protein